MGATSGHLKATAVAAGTSPRADALIVARAWVAVWRANDQILGIFTEALADIACGAVLLGLATDFGVVSATEVILTVNQDLVLSSGQFAQEIVVGMKQGETLASAVAVETLEELGIAAQIHTQSCSPTLPAVAAGAAFKEADLPQDAEAWILWYAVWGAAIFALEIAVVTPLTQVTDAVAAVCDLAVVPAGIGCFVTVAAAVIAGLVVVIFGREVDAEKTIATTSWLATVGASIAVQSVAVVAVLPSTAEEAVTTIRELAALDTGIFVIVVAIIATLHAPLSKAIAAECVLTGGGTRVPIVIIAIVAGLLWIEAAVATTPCYCASICWGYSGTIWAQATINCFRTDVVNTTVR